MTCRPRRTLSTTANRSNATLTDALPHRWHADRTLALAGYGLLFSSLFFFGLTGLVAVILAYSVRDNAKPDTRRHFDGQIRIFWVAVILSLLATAAGICGVIALVGGGVSWSLDRGLMPDQLDVGTGFWLFALLGGSILLWLITALWLLCASAVGFIRLATTGAEA